ncbi:MAG: hypothetical protein JO147_06700 [Actinobacteria bacterium]|nr:hypothetical protein [Actinomycetota bacterium]
MLDVAIRRADGQTVVDLHRHDAPALPVLPALSGLLPNGVRRGSTVAVSGSLSLLFALLGAGSADGAWCALVGLPTISAEAAAEYGIELSRLALVPAPGPGWSTAVGALLDAVDLVAVRPPPRLAPGDVRRLSARARTHDSVLMPYLFKGDQWAGPDLRLRADEAEWSGAHDGHGRLIRRRLVVSVEGRGQASRSRSQPLWLPAAAGGVETVGVQTVGVQTVGVEGVDRVDGATVSDLAPLTARAG